MVLSRTRLWGVVTEAHKRGVWWWWPLKAGEGGLILLMRDAHARDKCLLAPGLHVEKTVQPAYPSS